MFKIAARKIMHNYIRGSIL